MNLPPQLIKQVYESIWHCIKEDIERRNPKDNPDTFSYSLYKIGKLYTTKELINNTNKYAAIKSKED